MRFVYYFECKSKCIGYAVMFIVEQRRYYFVVICNKQNNIFFYSWLFVKICLKIFALYSSLPYVRHIEMK